MIFGAVTDTACLVWQTECGENSSCWIYDNFAVSRNYFLIAMSVKCLSTILFSVAFCTYKPPIGEEESNFGSTLHQNGSGLNNMTFVDGSVKQLEYDTVNKETIPRSNTDVTTNETTQL